MMNLTAEDLNVKDLLDKLETQNDEYNIRVYQSTISVYYGEYRLFSIELNDINNPKYDFGAMDLTVFDYERIDVWLTALSTARKCVDKNFVHKDFQ